MNYEIPNRKQRIQNLQKQLDAKVEEIKKNIFNQSKSAFEAESNRSIRLLGSEMLKKHFGQNFWVSAKKQFDELNGRLLGKYTKKYNWIKGESLNIVEYDDL